MCWLAQQKLQTNYNTLVQTSGGGVFIHCTAPLEMCVHFKCMDTNVCAVIARMKTLVNTFNKRLVAMAMPMTLNTEIDRSDI